MTGRGGVSWLAGSRIFVPRMTTQPTDIIPFEKSISETMGQLLGGDNRNCPSDVKLGSTNFPLVFGKRKKWTGAKTNKMIMIMQTTLIILQHQTSEQLCELKRCHSAKVDHSNQ